MNRIIIAVLVTAFLLQCVALKGMYDVNNKLLRAHDQIFVGMLIIAKALEECRNVQR